MDLVLKIGESRLTNLTWLNEVVSKVVIDSLNESAIF
jgi:hypothetical protein